MARRTTVSPPPKPPPQTREALERGIRRLKDALNAVEEYKLEQFNEDNEPLGILELRALIQASVEKAFPEGSSGRDRYVSAHEIYGSTGYVSWDGRDFAGERQAYARDVERAKGFLRSAIAELERDLEDLREASTPLGVFEPALSPKSSRIFIVHGHDDGPKEAVARFVSALGYQPVILHEQPNRGRTIIQKFREEAADVGFAIVLLTPDDETPTGHRARQNVVLELGFFLGVLGADHVAPIVKGRVETPSDFDGVLYTPYDAGWKVAVAKELAAAGYKVDWNVVMS
jgi:predicted nucleotide-binding protein